MTQYDVIRFNQMADHLCCSLCSSNVLGVLDRFDPCENDVIRTEAGSNYTIFEHNHLNHMKTTHKA
jgi:hypothetical protein